MVSSLQATHIYCIIQLPIPSLPPLLSLAPPPLLLPPMPPPFPPLTQYRKVVWVVVPSLLCLSTLDVHLGVKMVRKRGREAQQKLAKPLSEHNTCSTNA